MLADLVVVVHLAYLGYVVLGGLLGLRDVRWLVPHLASVAWGVAGTATRLPCPLTALEKKLDTAAGVSTYDGPFIAQYLAGTLYPVQVQPLVWQAAATVVAGSYLVVLDRHQHGRLGPGARPPLPDPR